MDSLAALERNRGKLTLTGGNELRLSQNLNNEGTLTLAKAGKLYVDGQLTTSGQLVVGPDTYLEVTDSINAMTGSVTLDGLVHAPDLTTSATTVLSGAGELTGSLDVGGDFLATIAEPGLDANELVVHGQTMLGGNLLLQLGGYIPQSDDVLSILNAMGGLSGAFSNVASGERLETADGIGSFLVNYMMGSGRNRVLLTAFEPSGDYNGDGTFDAADYVVWRKTDGSQNGYDTWRANFGRRTAGSGATTSAGANAPVPEPPSATLCCLFSLLLLIRRRLAAN